MTTGCCVRSVRPSGLSATDGVLQPVSDDTDSVVARVLVDQSDRLMTVAEYRINAGQRLTGWLHADGDMILYVVSGRLDFKVEDVGVTRLGSHDLIYHAAATRYRWTLVDGESVHVLVVLTRPWGDPDKLDTAPRRRI